MLHDRTGGRSSDHQCGESAQHYHVPSAAPPMFVCARRRYDEAPQKDVSVSALPRRPARKRAHRNVASHNLRRLQRINSQDERVSLRVEGDR